MRDSEVLNQIVFSETATKEEIGWLGEGLERFNLDQTRGEFSQPGIEINQLIKDPDGKVVGGVNASTMYRVMHLEVLWVADEYRKYGLASQLVLGAEQIGAQHGCLSTQTMSFSFQAPGFYQKLGYKVLGIYTGYPFGISEYVLNKRLNSPLNPVARPQVLTLEGLAGEFSISDDPSPQELEVLHQGLHGHVVENIGDKYKGMAIRLAAKHASGELAGGLTGFTTINNLILESMWVEEKFRGHGIGSRLLDMAEQMAIKNGCVASQAICLSFQGVQFFSRRGFEIYGISDSYPAPVQEYHMIKRYP